MSHDQETEEVCNVIISETGNTTKGFCRTKLTHKHRTDHVSKHYNDIRICVYSATSIQKLAQTNSYCDLLVLFFVQNRTRQRSFAYYANQRYKGTMDARIF